jgi:hypothetical protein
MTIYLKAKMTVAKADFGYPMPLHIDYFSEPEHAYFNNIQIVA